LEADEKYQIKVTEATQPKGGDQEDRNYKQEYVEEMKEIGLEEIMKRNISHILKEYQRDTDDNKNKDKKAEFDL